MIALEIVVCRIARARGVSDLENLYALSLLNLMVCHSLVVLCWSTAKCQCLSAGAVASFELKQRLWMVQRGWRQLCDVLNPSFFLSGGVCYVCGCVGCVESSW
jgi:hypothetical protein